jgi:hypothetical protein
MNAYLLFSFDFGPPTVGRIFEQIDPSDWDRPIDPDRFTPREIIAHLADWEPIMLGRMQAAVKTSGAVLEAYDEVKMAEDHGYRSSDPFEQLDLWKHRRAVTAEWVRSLPKEDWEKEALHPERGSQSAEDLANLIICHDLYHIEQLSAYLAR